MQSQIDEDAFSNAAAALCHPTGQEMKFAQLVRNSYQKVSLPSGVNQSSWVSLLSPRSLVLSGS